MFMFVSVNNFNYYTDIGQMSYEVALTGKSCDETCQGVSAFCAAHMTASMALWHAFDEQGHQIHLYISVNLKQLFHLITILDSMKQTNL